MSAHIKAVCRATRELCADTERRISALLPADFEDFDDGDTQVDLLPYRGAELGTETQDKKARAAA